MNNRHHYEAAMTMKNQKRCLIIRRQIGKLTAIEHIIEAGGCFTSNYIAIYAANANAVCKKFVYAVK